MSQGCPAATGFINIQAGQSGEINFSKELFVEPPSGSAYGHARRFAAMFAASLKNPASPSLVAQKILEIIDSNTWVLRHPVGPDAVRFLKWRGAMTDEEWVDWGAADDETWYRRVERDFGLDARPKN